MKMMIKNAKILTLNDEDFWHENGDIVIDDGKITAIGHHLKPEYFEPEKIIMADNKIAIPGLVNAHFHSADRFQRGQIDNLPLELFMARYNPPIGRPTWSSRACYLRTALCAIEMLKSGITTVFDDLIENPANNENINTVFQTYQDIGIRALVSIYYMDKPFYKTIPYLEEILPKKLKEEAKQTDAITPDQMLKCWSNYGQKWCGRVGFFLSPAAPQRCTEDFLKKTWELSKELDLPVMLHVLESKVQDVTGPLFYGKSIVEYMESMGLLTPKTTLFHSVWVNDRDIDLISEAESSIVHNPVSNLKLGSGIAPIRKIINKGINVGLGTDGNTCNDSANLFETMKVAALLHKSDFHYNKWIGAKDVLKMASRGGARCGCLHREIGMIAVGMKADIVLLDLNNLSLVPKTNLLNQLVFCEHGESVDTVIVDGNIVMEDNELVGINEQKILDEVVELQEEINDKIRRHVGSGGGLEPYYRQAYLRCVEQEVIK